jgi:hypothetical protein
MSSSAHEPGQSGSSQANSSVTIRSSSVNKVTPRRNASEASVSTADTAIESQSATDLYATDQYDSDEVPVLIRLPNLYARSPETPAPKSSSRKQHRIDQPSGNNTSSKRPSSKWETKINKKSMQEYASNNKLVIGGVAGGLLVVVMLLLLNSGDAQPAPDQDSWAQHDLAAQEPEISIPTGNEPQGLYPGFAYEPPQAETTQFSSDASVPAPLDVSTNDETLAAPQLQSIALPNLPVPKMPVAKAPVAKDRWPGEELMGPAIATDSNQTLPLPRANLNIEKNGSPHPTTGMTDQNGYRSTMNREQAESYRIGQVNQNRQPTQQDVQTGSILNRNLTYPDTKSYR